MPSARRWALALLIGAGLGLAGLGLEHAPAPVSTLSAQGALWLVVAFLAGGLVARPLRGGIAGAAALVLAMTAYYLGKAVVDSPLNPTAYDDGRAFWFAAAVVGGVFFGVGGAAWSSGGRWVRVIPVAALAAIVLTEALWQVRASSVWLVMAAVALTLPLVLLRGKAERGLGIALTLPLAGLLWLMADVVLPVVLRFR